MKYNNIWSGILGIIFAVVFVYVGIWAGSFLADKIVAIRVAGSDSYTAGVTIILFMVCWLPVIYLVTKKLIKNPVLGKYFLWAGILLDGLFILWTLFYLSL